ncbi:MAG: DUF5103 domain-containing protein [Candidatus Kapabacteria bacterium]|nr:DUF5103 domain-containing protein [Candidatus Kapabacteria bacterium]
MIRHVLVGILLSASLCLAQDELPTVRMIRAYGGTNEQLPPIVMLDSEAEHEVGSPFATVEFDLAANTIPNVYARATHCTADWRPDDNGFLADITNRTSLVNWSLAPERSKYYRYRGKIKIPNEQTTLKFSGNWLITIYDLNTDAPIAQTRIFAVNKRAAMQLAFMTDFYEPKKRVSSIAYTIEATVTERTGKLLTNNLHTVTYYRNHRWNEPFIVSDQVSTDLNPRGVGNAIVGILQGGKVFRISRLPAQNEYRVLDLTDLSRFPFTGQPVRMPLSDLRRNGMFIQKSDDGALITDMVSGYNDEYVPVEINLDPAPGGASEDDVFVVGSFNNWKPDRTWMMHYDEELRLYRCRNWLRRGRQDYLYATGRLSADSDEILDLSFEEFEGNTASASNSFVAFAYYREFDFGGYDGIVAVTASNIYTNGR